MIDGCFNEWVVHYFIYLIVLYIAALLCFVYITIATDQPNLDPHAPNRLGTFICVTPTIRSTLVSSLSCRMIIIS
jgi:hypothetical protein